MTTRTETATTIPRPRDRDEWLAARRPWFNASAVGALFDCHPFQHLSDVVRAKLDPATEQSAGNNATARGNHLEPAVANWWAAEHGVELVEPDVMYVRGDLMATLDRRIVGVDDECVEIKTTARYVSGPELHWWWQCQCQMYCADLRRVHLAVLDASMALQTFVIARDDEAIAQLVKRARDVMEYVTVDQWPPSVPKRADRVRHSDRVLELDAGAREQFDAWLAAREHLHQLETLEAMHKSALVEILGDAQAATIDGRQVLSFRSHTRTNVDLTRLRTEHAELAAELSVEQIVRVLRPVTERKAS
jgi:predicted phage-related endonuclease